MAVARVRGCVGGLQLTLPATVQLWVWYSASVTDVCGVCFEMFALVFFVLGAGSVAGQLSAGFDAASASSMAVGDYGAANAIAPGSGYWCSAGGHGQGQSVRWTGQLQAAHSVVGIRLNW